MPLLPFASLLEGIALAQAPANEPAVSVELEDLARISFLCSAGFFFWNLRVGL